MKKIQLVFWTIRHEWNRAGVHIYDEIRIQFYQWPFSMIEYSLEVKLVLVWINQSAWEMSKKNYTKLKAKLMSNDHVGNDINYTVD